MHSLIRTKEHDFFEVPASQFFVDGKLQLFEDTQKRGYFQIRASGDKLRFQAGGFIGLIPINELVTIEVAPRTPIANLDRLLRIANAESSVIRRITRSYSETSENLSLLDVLIDELIEALAQIAYSGRVKTYEQKISTGAPRSGRILVKQTLRERAEHPGQMIVSTSRYERTANNLVNATVKCAIEKLAATLSQSSQRKGMRARLQALNEAWQLFANVDTRRATPSAIQRIRESTVHMPSDEYRRALSVSVAVLTDRGPSATNEHGALSLSSLIYNLSLAFEAYVRNVLSRQSQGEVHDGNFLPPQGLMQGLFIKPATKEIEKMAATPDIVLGPAKTPWAVVDVKYKIFGDAPGREDVNQVLTYSLVYGVKICILIYPAEGALTGLMDIGMVGDRKFYCYGINLLSDNIESEEEAMNLAIAGLRPPEDAESQ